MASMEQYEMSLEQAQRQVIEAEARVAAQVAWIAELNRLHYDTTKAEAQLAVLKNELGLLYEG
jgi:uncharacterized coiled-coil protein SlyX